MDRAKQRVKEQRLVMNVHKAALEKDVALWQETHSSMSETLKEFNPNANIRANTIAQAEVGDIQTDKQVDRENHDMMMKKAMSWRTIASRLEALQNKSLIMSVESNKFDVLQNDLRSAFERCIETVAACLDLAFRHEGSKKISDKKTGNKKSHAIYDYI